MATTILVIDDSEDDRHLYQRAFKDFGCYFNLVMASSAEAGLASAAGRKPDLILLDYNLPDMDGISFMKKLAASSDTAIPIIMLTGDGSATVAVEAMKQGADDYLVKDTEGLYLRLLPGVAERAMAAHAQRAQTLQLRRETEALLLRNQILMQNSMDGIYIMDMSGNIVEANDAFCRMLGYTPEETSCLNVADWDAQWSAEELRERFLKLIGNSARFETVHRRKDGGLINVEISVSNMKIGGQYLLIAVSRDITERKKTEAMLRQHKLVIDTSIDGFWVTDMLGNVLEANAAYAAMSGYAVEELVGMHISQLEAIELKPEDVHAHIAKIVAQGYDRFETRHRHKDGHEIEIEVSVTCMAQPPQLFVFCRDITERKLANLELQRKQDLLNEAERLGKLGSWELDLPSGKLRWSDEMYRIFEIDPSRFSHSYDGFLNAIHPDDRDKVNQAYTRSLLDHQPYDVVHRLLFADGRIKWVREHCTSEFDVVGKPLRSRGMSQDITGHKEAETALLKGEANLRAMLDNSPYMTWLKDAKGRYITVNKVFADYLRLADASQAAGKTDLDLQPKELAEKYRADDAEVMAARRQKHVEEAAFDGKTTHWVETFKTPIIDARGKVRGTVGFARDITGRKNTEEALRVAAAAFETRDAIVITDASANIIRVNQAFSDITGYSPAEVLGRNPGMMRSGRHDRAFYAEMWQQLLRTGSWTGEIWDKRKNGEVYPKSLTITAVKNDHQETTQYVAIFSDITERKKAEEEILQESAAEHRRAEVLAQQFGHLLQSSFNEIYLFDADSLHFLQVSAGAEKNLGYSDAELGQFTPLDLLPLFDRKSMAKLLAPLRSGERQSLLFETVHRRKDGTTYPVEVRLQFMEVEPPVFMAIVQDITERRRAEKQSREFSAHLQAVREQEKASVAREIHDDLGGTLAALKMDAYWLARKLAGEKEADALLERAESMSDLLDSALKAMRRIVTDLRPTILDDVGLMAALKWQGAEFNKRTGIECRVICICGEDHDCEDELDDKLTINLFRIFQESLTNVARHSGATRVEVELHRGGEEILLSVIDNGCGLPEAHAVAPTSYGMRGMHERVEQLGGKIKFDNLPDRGFSVTVILPVPPGTICQNNS